jgi:hypothetical protein
LVPPDEFIPSGEETWALFNLSAGTVIENFAHLVDDLLNLDYVDGEMLEG